jgi:hypothetical protein
MENVLNNNKISKRVAAFLAVMQVLGLVGGSTVASIVLGACPHPTSSTPTPGPGPGPGPGPTIEYDYRVIFNGQVGNGDSNVLKVNSGAVDLTIDIKPENGGYIEVIYPSALQNTDSQASHIVDITTLSLKTSELQDLFSADRMSIPVKIKPEGASGVITTDDAGDINSKISTALAAFAKKEQETIEDGVHKNDWTEIGSGAASLDTSAIDEKNQYDSPSSAESTVTLWNTDDATVVRDDTTTTVTINVANKDGGTLNAGILNSLGSNAIQPGDTVKVEFSRASSGTGLDTIRFGKLAELRTAILAKNGNGANIHMESSTVAGQEVTPLFNAYDVYANVFNASKSSNGDEIFEGMTVKNTTTTTGWYIDVASGKKVKVDVIGMPDATKLKGFGLEVANRTDLSFAGSPILSGLESSSDGTGTAVAASYYNNAFNMLKISTVADFRSLLFEPKDLYLTAGVIDSNSKLVQFFESYMDNSSNLNKLKNGFYIPNSTGIYVDGGANPYAVNAVSPSASELNGNVAVFLGSKGVSLRELKLTNPNLYTSGSIAQARNLILDGSDWKNIDIGYSQGVITSVNTPVKSISDPSNSSLWYRVMGHNGEGYITPLKGNNNIVLEFGNVSATDVVKISTGGSNLSILAQISPDAARNSVINAYFSVPSNRVYYSGSTNGARPSTTLQSWASTVMGNGTPTISLAPADKSIRLAGAKGARAPWCGSAGVPGTGLV